MKKFFLYGGLLCLPILLFFAATAQNVIQAGKMVFEYQMENDSLAINIKAPTKGWLGVGFNAKNDIVGSDLLQFSVRNKKAICSDQFVVGFQDHPEDAVLGGSSNISLLDAQEKNGWTSISFKIPLYSGDRFDFQHQSGKDCWLILAYSLDDDFNHHSVMRKHVKLRL